MNNNRTLFPMLCLCLPLLCFTASTGNAAESSDSESWEFAGELFGLGARVDGTTSAGEDIDVPLHDLLDNLDFDLKQVISTFGAGYQVAETQST